MGSLAVKKVTATHLRDKLKTYLKEATANRVVLVENRRQPSKDLVAEVSWIRSEASVSQFSPLWRLSRTANSPIAC